MKKQIVFVCILFFGFNTVAQINHQFYFGENIQANTKIKEPGQLSGHTYGEWHFSHDQLVTYFNYLSESSDRVTMVEYGRTYEGRPLYLFFISSEENIQNLDEINRKHINWIYSKNNQISPDDIPLIIWLGYSVHGNESSGANAAMLAAYYLVASEDENVKDYLKKSVIIIDPCINPDGFNRNASWVNMHQSKNWIKGQQSIQFNEDWPGGRTNHYWFDLNRDWLLVQHPETKARLAYYHKWKPAVVTDHHEMGTNGTFFFQPGVPARVNPNTPDENYILTKKLGYFHADALDKTGSLYYSEENFDDFYYGKGSSYPDANAAIGILFEQARVNGQAVNNINGVTTFADAIRNQFKVSISTIEGALAHKKEFQEYQRSFFVSVNLLVRNSDVKGYAFGCKDDKVKIYYFLEMLQSHDIELYRNKESIQIQNVQYGPDEAFIVPLNQHQYRLIKSLFEVNKNFKDSIFYDISTWNMPFSFNIDAEELVNTEKYTGKKVKGVKFPLGQVVGGTSEIGYVFGWRNYHSPNVLYQLLQKGIMAKVATKPFQIKTGGKVYEFGYGSIFIPAQHQIYSSDEIYLTTKEICTSEGVDIYSLENGFRYAGIHFGSSNFIPLTKPGILLLCGEGISSQQAGEIWHLLDFRMSIPVVRVKREELNRLDIFNYNTLILPDGRYKFNNNEIEKLNIWLKEGGRIIVLGKPAEELSRQGWFKLKVRETEKGDSLDRYNYISAREREQSAEVNGIILRAEIDISDPICYGYINRALPVLKNSKLVFEKNKDPYSCPVYLPANSLLSGYLKKGQENYIGNSAYIQHYTVGEGKVIIFSEDPNFRGYWYGTNKLFLNAIFFSDLIRDYK